MGGNELGDFVRTRRSKLLPEDLGLPPGEHRRVPGLRREEVAVDADLSVDFYRRLEQGREPHPSERVLSALTRTLRLDVHEQQHLYSLAGVAWRLHDRAYVSAVPSELLDLLDSWREAGAIVLDPVLDVLAMNEKAEELFDGFAETSNLLEMVFLDPEGRRFFVDWEASAEATVANLRASADFAATPARQLELLDELRAESPEFPAIWAKHDVRPKTHETKLLRHHTRGLLTAEFHAFNVASLPGYLLFVYNEREPQE